MKKMLAASAVMAVMIAGSAYAEHQVPPQAYEDCRGRKAGEEVQHTTPEGKVAATCQDSPQGLVARPNQPRGANRDEKPRQMPPKVQQ